VISDERPAAALARLYDLDLADDPGDLDLYLAMAERTGGPILELAAGTGRLAVPLAEAGHHVTAVDLDPAMLARAAAALGRAEIEDRLELVEGDARSIRLPSAGSFRLAFVALGSILLVGGRSDQARVVQTLADHLAPGGLAVLDAWLPDADDLARYDGRLILEWTRADAGTGEVVTKTGSAIHDAASGTIRLTSIFESAAPGEPVRRWVREDALRLVGGDDMMAFAEAAGLEVEVLAGGYDLEPLDFGADRVVLVARKS
jgi:SAM-dependent methyltransferase